MSTTPIAAPSRAKRNAPALPIPEAAAVTMPILPWSRMVPSVSASGSGRDVLAVVECVECGNIDVTNHMALDLQSRRHLTIGDRKGLRRDREAPHPLDRRQPLVDACDHRAYRPGKSGVAGEPAKISGWSIRNISGGKLGVGNEQSDEIGPAVAEHHRLGDFRLERQIAFDARRRDRLAAGILDEIAFAVGDPDVAVFVDEADIAGLEPAVFEDLRRRFGIVPVSLHDVVAGHQDLAVLGYLHPNPVEWRPDSVDLDVRGRIAGDDRGGLGLPVALQQPDPERHKETPDLGIEGR